MIRACFTGQEYRSRGACHDEYELDGIVTLAPGAKGERRRIPRADLVWEADPACSYRRAFAFNAASGHYEPDRALPDCENYRLP